MKKAIGVLFLFVGISCHGSLVPVVIEPTDTDKCPAACAHLQMLGCAEGQPLEDGTTCEQFCTDTQENGQPLNPTCVMSIKTCAGINACTQSR